MGRLNFILLGMLLSQAVYSQITLDSLAQYHPTQIGNKWIYRAIRPPIIGFQDPDTLIVTREILHDTLVDGVRNIVISQSGGFFPGQYSARYDTLTGNYYERQRMYDSTKLNTNNSSFDRSRMIFINASTDTLFHTSIIKREVRTNTTGRQERWSYAYGLGLISYSFYDILPDAEENWDLLSAKINGKEYGLLLSVDRQPEASRSFILNQNYPNPCNPGTTISFSIPSKTYICLKVFDVAGREVSSLLSEELPAGNYTRQWNAGSLTSGVYFYRLQAGAHAETKRLMLVK